MNASNVLWCVFYWRSSRSCALKNLKAEVMCGSYIVQNLKINWYDWSKSYTHDFICFCYRARYWCSNRSCALKNWKRKSCVAICRLKFKIWIDLIGWNYMYVISLVFRSVRTSVLLERQYWRSNRSCATTKTNKIK